ncbi:serine carboxypeptidase [Hymenopellis radicata]|nr:serine carboxypeptidase [Hymenopellis radicata]
MLRILTLALGALYLHGVGADQIPEIKGVIDDGAGIPKNLKGRGQPELKSISAPVQREIVSAPANRSLRVTENSGVCETTPDVYQASGYVNLTETEAIFFWYFAARNNSEDAPLALWFNGGPGSSSMVGLFQELGPCRITNDSSSVTLNPYAWNNNANMLFIDQPVGVGFSYGDLKVGSAHDAAVDIWKFMQIFLADERFANLNRNGLAIWTESYGGRYGPTFADYFLSQNDAIAAGKVEGAPLNLTVLGIGNGFTDALLQFPADIAYAQSNPYQVLVPDILLQIANFSFHTAGGCEDLIKSCYINGTDDVCLNAQQICNQYVDGPLSSNRDVYDFRSPQPASYPPALEPYLTNVSLQASIGAEKNWSITNENVYINFAMTGDGIRNSRGLLGGCHRKGRPSYSIRRRRFRELTVDGEVAGLYKSAANTTTDFTYVRVYGAGHEVPAYSYGSLEIGEAALRLFEQAMGVGKWTDAGGVRPS